MLSVLYHGRRSTGVSPSRPVWTCVLTPPCPPKCIWYSTARAHWEAYGRGRLPLHYLVSDSAYPLTTCQIHYHSQCGIIVALDSSEP